MLFIIASRKPLVIIMGKNINLRKHRPMLLWYSSFNIMMEMVFHYLDVLRYYSLARSIAKGILHCQLCACLNYVRRSFGYGVNEEYFALTIIFFFLLIINKPYQFQFNIRVVKRTQTRWCLKKTFIDRPSMVIHHFFTFSGS